MKKEEIEEKIEEFYDEKAFIYVRKKHYNLIRHHNGKITEILPDAILFLDYLTNAQIKIKKIDILLIDYSWKSRGDNGK